MTAFVATRTIDGYDPFQRSLQERVAKAFQNQDTYAEANLRKLLGQPQFEIFGTTDSNTAAASSPVISLSDEGVTFPANTYRNIEVEVTAFNGAQRFHFRTRQRILGGTAPTLSGPEQWLTDTYASYGFTTADGALTTEDSACIGPAWHGGAAPAAGAIASNALTITWLGAASLPSRLIIPGSVAHADAAAAAADTRSFQHGTFTAADSSTVVFISDVATPTEATFSNDSVVRVTAQVFPPIHCPVLIDAAADPDEVIIGALGLSSDVVTWHIKVFVGDLITAGPLV